MTAVHSQLESLKGGRLSDTTGRQKGVCHHGKNKKMPGLSSC
ncbi:hypothetical protein BAOM_1416 [Peribacillus asahii]|uniref:Uncharacterized protein n=1 Tax=Peribacillus asahii TaxID=228899 RepID=A0A3Q9RL00_9BACI|nr:hypothetical protein BAOM_1416 [Peribacillus asahii]